MEKHSLRGAAMGRVRRQDRWNLPPPAAREALTNAVVHADYSQQGAPIRVAIFDDRLEVENPGLLPFGLTSILDLLERDDARGTREIADAIGLSTRATRTRLAKLVAHGLVREMGTGPKDPRRRYIKASH